LQAEVDLNVKNKDGRTALMMAARWGHDDIVEMLQKARAKE
jgi:ankyrin repeat protein